MNEKKAGRGRIVVVEDDADYREHLSGLLAENGYEVQTAEDGASGLVLIRRCVPEAVIVDWNLPVMDGGSLTRALKSDPAFADTVVIIASARGEGEMRAEGIEIGADDYLVKPIETKELLARLRNGLKLRRLQSELREKNRELERIAVTDALTDLPNRRVFDNDLERELDRAHRYGDAVALAVLDIDHFKAVNDTYGHDVGDEVLRQLARRVRDACRAGDEVARIGGEEFAVILLRTAEKGARAAAERLARSVETLTFSTSAGDLTITVSVGVACAGGEIGFNALDVFKAADDALYRSKNEGRNRVTVSTTKPVRKTRGTGG
jgi:diguanylate cyclase (GGDEF)-like protein